MHEFEVGDLVEYKTPGSFKRFGVYLGIEKINTDIDHWNVFVVFSLREDGTWIEYLFCSQYESGDLIIKVRSPVSKARG